MAQISNDCKGLTYVGLDSGQMVFRRPEVTATGVLTQTSQVTTNTVNWIGLAGNCIDLYATVASGTGIVTTPSSSTATTGPAAG